MTLGNILIEQNASSGNSFFWNLEEAQRLAYEIANHLYDWLEKNSEGVL